MFTNCFKTETFSDCSKNAEVLPIFKKDPSEATNYQPISLLSYFDKILEKLNCYRLLEHLIKNNLLNTNQFGFHPNSSTILAISKFMILKFKI